MGAETANLETSNLAQHIRSTIFENAKKNRKDIELVWQRNRALANVDPEFDNYVRSPKQEKAEEGQSNTMVDVVRQKVVAAKAIISDTAFKGQRVQFMLVPPEGEEAGPESGVGREPIIKANEDYIQRQLSNCNAVGEFGKCVLSGAIYGRYFAKRYTTQMEMGNGFEQVDGNIFVEAVTDTTTRAIQYVSPFNMYWDMESDDLIEGEFVIQTDLVSPAMLRDDIGKPLYFDKYIMAAITSTDKNSQAGYTNSPNDDTSSLPARLRDIKSRSRNIHKLEFWGRVPRKMVAAFEKMLELDLEVEAPADRDTEELPEDAGDMVEIFAVLANEQIIAFSRLNSAKDRIYYMGDWEEVLDGNCGRGIADNLFNIVKVLNTSVRTLEDNMLLASRLILALKRSMIEEDVEAQLNSDKRVVMLTVDESSRGSARDAIEQVKVQSMINELSAIITMNREFADEASSIPKAEQGMQTSNPQTAFELQQRLERSGKYMSEVIKRLDKFIEAILNDFYKYNMEDADYPIQKGVYKVRALGFSSFDNKVIRLQKLMQFFALVIDRPEVLRRIKLDWIIEEIAKGMDLDPAQLFKSDEEMQAEAEAEANSPAAKAQALEIEGRATEIEKSRSDVAKNAKEGEKIDADIAINAEKLNLEREKLKTDRAKVIADARNKAAATAAKPKKESQ